MPTYYNENDPRAAAWLRELMKAGAISYGEIDTRSIVDVQPDDLRGFTWCHFFAGIGGWDYALRLAGWPSDRPVWTGSCPCQPWSMAGKGEGAADPRHLWPAWFRLIAVGRPGVIVGEQTASKDGEYWLDLVFTDLEGSDYAIGAFNLPAACIGAPHARHRFYFVADTDREGRDWLAAARLHERWAAARGSEAAPGDADGARRDDADGRCADGGPVGDTDGSGAREQSGELRGDEGQHDQRAAHRDHAPIAAGADSRAMGDTAGGDGARDSREQGAPRCAPQGRGEAQGSRRAEPRDAGASGGLGDTPGEGRERFAPEGSARSWGQRTTVERAGAALPLADPDGDGFGGRRRPGRGRARHQGALADDSGATRGFWFPCDWVPCREPDGTIKVRPVEPGTFPLAHGVSARVGRLRGYGNAIVPELAAEVLAAYLEVRP